MRTKVISSYLLLLLKMIVIVVLDFIDFRLKTTTNKQQTPKYPPMAKISYFNCSGLTLKIFRFHFRLSTLTCSPTDSTVFCFSFLISVTTNGIQ